MFKELLLLLATRSLILTVGSVKDEKIRVTVTPRPTSKDEAKEVLQPFVVEGTAEELDNELPKAIETYTGEILTLAQTVERLKASTAEALAAIKAENEKKIADAKKKPGTSGTAKPAAKAEPKPEPVKPPAPPSLFDAPADEAAPAAAPTPGEVPAGTSSDEDDPDETPDGSDDDDVEDAEEEEENASVPSNVSTFPSSTVAAGQSSMFDIEEEILKEAFHGSDNQLVAA